MSKLVVGLGNPGSDYAATRHNIGFRIVERFAAQERFPGLSRRGLLFKSDARESVGTVDGLRVAVLQPLSFMNRSGRVVARKLDELELEPSDLLVCYDELALPLGRLRLRAGGSAAGHNGVESVIEALGTEDFPRLRFGIQPAGRRGDQVDFVLSPFRRDEIEVVEDALGRAAHAVVIFCREGIQRAMNQFNREVP